jgi:hypothetical protein
VNAPAVIDLTRAAGRVRAILLQPGTVLGSGWGLAAMHERSTSEPSLWFMARGLLTNVRRFDRFVLRSGANNPDLTGTHNYEVGDGPRPVGFGRYLATLVEISDLTVNPLRSNVAEGSVLTEEAIDVPWN